MKSLKLMVAALVLSCTATAAHAQNCVGGLGLGYLYGYGGYNTGVSNYNHNVPYFALHPPVYYGQKYTRPYGVSPFAAWPQLQGNPGYSPVAQLNEAPAAVIMNPHVNDFRGGGAVSGVVEVTAPEPKVILNPYAKIEQRYTAKKAKK